MESIWFSEKTNLFSLLCPHKFKGYMKDAHNYDLYKSRDYVYFEKTLLVKYI